MKRVETFFKYCKEVDGCSIVCDRKTAKEIVDKVLESGKTFFEDIDGRNYIEYTFNSKSDIILIEKIDYDGVEFYIEPYRDMIIENDIILIQNELKPLINTDKLYSDVILNI